jgi:type IV pilus assembly protein PilB
MVTSRTGEILVKRGLLSAEQLQRALKAQRQERWSLEGALINLKMLSEADLVDALSAHYGIPIFDLQTTAIDQTAIALVPYCLAAKHGVMPLTSKQGALTIAISEPADIAALNEIKFITGLDIHPRLTSSRAIAQLHEQFYQRSPEYDSLIGDVVQEDLSVQQQHPDESELSELLKATEDAPIVKLVHAVLTDAVRRGASDIHVEPYEKGFRIRFRIDGVLSEIMQPPARLKNAVTSRLKIMANLNIAERRMPQDGRIKVRCIGDSDTDFRVNVLPTLFGEKVVLRLLDTTSKHLTISGLGLDTTQNNLFEAAIKQPHGLILVTGPTGSGKTTTLYAALSHLNTISTNISTAEDPVEMNLSGINQTQINEEIGFTFAEALRAFLRQDPDIIMVGEIRDLDTAETAVKAAMTGHLVLSTIHTNDAPCTINRLLNMGVAPYLVASSLNLVVAQRLARRLCLECRAPSAASASSLTAAGMATAESVGRIFFEARGCTKCSGTGYRGRIALYEVMNIDEHLRDLILHGASAPTLKQAAIKQGMVTLRQSALRHLCEGTTSLDEVLRVTAQDSITSQEYG